MQFANHLLSGQIQTIDHLTHYSSARKSILQWNRCENRHNHTFTQYHLFTIYFSKTIIALFSAHNNGANSKFIKKSKIKIYRERESKSNGKRFADEAFIAMKNVGSRIHQLIIIIKLLY